VLLGFELRASQERGGKGGGRKGGTKRERERKRERGEREREEKERERLLLCHSRLVSNLKSSCLSFPSAGIL
jgi:hypothetical protein